MDVYLVKPLLFSKIGRRLQGSFACFFRDAVMIPVPAGKTCPKQFVRLKKK
jgi:hypothetical protein